MKYYIIKLGFESYGTTDRTEALGFCQMWNGIFIEGWTDKEQSKIVRL